MNQITVDGAMKSQFLQAGEACVVVDAAGNRLGLFTPKYVGYECPYSDDDLTRIEQKGGGRPLADILRDLEKLRMKYTVLWSEEAEARLANAWLLAADRESVTVAADQIDAKLKNDALEVGESRDGGRRIVHESPLGVVFSVDVENRKVLVLDMWVY